MKSRLEKVKMPAYNTEEDELDRDTINQNRSVVGCLSWLAKQTRPDLQFMVAQAQRTQNQPKIKDIKWTNSAVDVAKKYVDHGVKIKKIEEKQLCVLCFHDAAWANAHLEGELPEDESWDGSFKKASQLASLVFVGGQAVMKAQPVSISMVDWKSRASSRICRSTFAEETMACGETASTSVDY